MCSLSFDRITSQLALMSPQAPSLHLHTILSLKGQWLHLYVEFSRNPVTLSVWPLSLPAHTFSPCFAEPGQIYHNLISSASSPNSTCPLFALFPFFSLSFFLRTPHYPLSAFLILSTISHCLFRPNLPLFSCLSASAAIC